MVRTSLFLVPWIGYTNVRILLQSGVKFPNLLIVPIEPTRFPL